MRKLLVVLVYLLRIQLNSFSPFSALLSLLPYPTGQEEGWILLCLDIISLEGMHFPCVQSKLILCLNSPVKGRGVSLLLLKKEKERYPLELNVEKADEKKGKSKM